MSEADDLLLLGDEGDEGEEEEDEGVPLWAKSLVALLILGSIAALLYFTVLRRNDGDDAARGLAATTTTTARTTARQDSLCGTAPPLAQGEAAQTDSEGCDRIVQYDSVRARCPLGWAPMRKKDGTMCCKYAPQQFGDRDAAVRGSKAFVIGVNIGAGIATELVLPWAMRKAMTRLYAKGLKLSTRLVNRMLVSGSRFLVRIATAAAKAGIKLAVAGAKMAAKLAAGPPGWVLFVLQILTLVLDIWDPENYNAFEANRIFIGGRNIIITSFHAAMVDNRMEPPFIFPLSLAFPKEFEAAFADVITRATSNYLAELCEEEQVLFWTALFTGEDELSATEKRVLARINRGLEEAAGKMDPRVRDNEIYKRMCLLVGQENLWMDDTLSASTRIAVSVSAEWARQHNEKLAAIYQSSGPANEGPANQFLPMISFSKYWYVPDGSQSVEVMLSLGNVDQAIGAVAGLFSQSAGEAIAPISTVPVIRRTENPSGRAIPQYNLMGEFKYNTCMGVRNCDKLFLRDALCSATRERDLRYSDYGVDFDDDKLICRITCQLCERFGLRFTDFDDPSITNVPNAKITDCDFYPGQDIFELIFGMTLTRTFYRAYQELAQLGQEVINFAIRVYNEMCDTMRPGQGLCPTNCDRPQDCTPEACIATCKNNVVTRTICDVIDAACCCCGFATAAACELCKLFPDCRTVTEYVLDTPCHNACEINCALMRIPGYCETWQGACGVVGKLCDFVGEVPEIDNRCSFMH